MKGLRSENQKIESKAVEENSIMTSNYSFDFIYSTIIRQRAIHDNRSSHMKRSLYFFQLYRGQHDFF